MRKHAVVDIGTNSMRLLLTTIKNGKIIERKKYINTTRIGASVDKDRIISEEGIIRNINALYDFVQKSRQYGAENIEAIATSAVRDAKNREDFIKQAYEKTGVNIEIISGEEEARLGYIGVVRGQQDSIHNNIQNDTPAPKMQGGEVDCLIHPNSQQGQITIVIDIGGGSTELIIGQGDTLNKTISLDIGAVRMTERFITTSPVDLKEYKEMEKFIHRSILDSTRAITNDFNMRETKELASHTLAGEENLPIQSYNTVITMGIGGTITTLAALNQQLDPYDPDKIHNYKLTIENIKDLKEKLLSLTIKQIRDLKGIHPKRADIITAGITILYIIMDVLNLKEIIVSEYDNLEGVLYEKLLYTKA